MPRVHFKLGFYLLSEQLFDAVIIVLNMTEPIAVDIAGCTPKGTVTEHIIPSGGGNIVEGSLTW